MSEPGHLLDSLPDAPIGRSVHQRDRLPGIEWVVISIFVICLTALNHVNRREDLAMFTRMQQPSQNQHTVPDGFGPLTSHGGDHEQSPNTP
tara:strand:+ start:29802 stop:30074 length:273 start_codon:yes stop_codon:yes gene_type:complete